MSKKRFELLNEAQWKLIEPLLPEPKKGRPRQKPKRVIADRAYDSDPLRERLAKRGIELIVPYRANNKLRKYEDGRRLRRYKRRWIVTAIALSLGAPFWFDALNKFMVVRSTVKPQEKSRTDQSKDN